VVKGDERTANENILLKIIESKSDKQNIWKKAELAKLTEEIKAS
jgi:hypothetical protein